MRKKKTDNEHNSSKVNIKIHKLYTTKIRKVIVYSLIFQKNLTIASITKLIINNDDILEC